MRFPRRHALATWLFTACTAAPMPQPPTPPPMAEPAERAQLQRAHERSLEVELRGRLAADLAARGVRSVQAWWQPTSAVVDGEADGDGGLRVRLPGTVVHSPVGTVIVHLVDREGTHWWCVPALDAAPGTGVCELGTLAFAREPDALTVVDDQGHALPDAHVRYRHHGEFADLATTTDAHGHAALCRGAPFPDAPEDAIFVRHPDFAPWWGQPTARIELDHGGEVLGRVLLPAGADPGDYVAFAWIDEAAPAGIRGDAPYAGVTAPLTQDGSYRLRNVPWGRRSITVAGRFSIDSCGSSVEVEVGAHPTHAPEIALENPAIPRAVRLRVVDDRGHAVVGARATILVSDVGIPVPLARGFLDWVAGSEPFAIVVPGYATSAWTTHANGDTIVLRGGHRVALRLALDSARRLPPGAALGVTVDCLEHDDTGVFGDPIGYLVTDPEFGPTLEPDRDTEVLVTTPGRYRIWLGLVRWDAAKEAFDSVAIDTTPAEFEVPAAAESTLLTVRTEFVHLPD